MKNEHRTTPQDTPATAAQAEETQALKNEEELTFERFQGSQLQQKGEFYLTLPREDPRAIAFTKGGTWGMLSERKRADAERKREDRIIKKAEKESRGLDPWEVGSSLESFGILLEQYCALLHALEDSDAIQAVAHGVDALCAEFDTATKTFYSGSIPDAGNNYKPMAEEAAG